MFKKIRNRITDMAALAALLQDAEELARADGREKAGAEDLVVATLRHDDGRARELLAPHGVDADAYAVAVRDVQRTPSQERPGPPMLCFRAPRKCVARTSPSPLPKS